jgi:hypothetical protein
MLSAITKRAIEKEDLKRFQVRATGGQFTAPIREPKSNFVVPNQESRLMAIQILAHPERLEPEQQAALMKWLQDEHLKLRILA